MIVEIDPELIRSNKADERLDSKYKRKEIQQYIEKNLPNKNKWYINHMPCGFFNYFEIEEDYGHREPTIPSINIDIVDKVIYIEPHGKELYDFCYELGEHFNFNKLIKEYQ